jgi:aerobic-type carbon monoxide dehydrogenase small subunit (CoxS/CutS family)
VAPAQSVTFVLDGAQVTASVEPRTLLIDYLTFEAQLSGVHEGCCEGVCGACTVWIDEEPARSCLVYVVELSGRTVMTPVAALSQPRFDGVHAALAQEHAIQCGYCVTGLLMSVLPDLVRQGSEQECVTRLLSGNVCRCGGYTSIARALTAWRKSQRFGAQASRSGMGKPVG